MKEKIRVDLGLSPRAANWQGLLLRSTMTIPQYQSQKRRNSQRTHLALQRHAWLAFLLWLDFLTHRQALSVLISENTIYSRPLESSYVVNRSFHMLMG